MKWFKHFSDASDNDKIKSLIEWYGMEGYGRWWRLLELIAAQMDRDGPCCSSTMPVSVWRRELGYFHVRYLGMYLESLENVGLISVGSPSEVGKMSGESRSELLTISCSNLLKYRDSRLKNQRKVGHIEEEVEVDVEADVEKNIPPKPPKKRKPNQEISYGEDFLEAWKIYPRKSDKALAWQAWQKLNPTNGTREKIQAEILRQSKTPDWIKENGQFIPYFATWLNHRRWEDEPNDLFDRPALQKSKKSHDYATDLAETALQLVKSKGEQTHDRKNR